MADGAARVTPTAAVRDVIRRWPRTGDILLQQGRLFRQRPGDPYASYSPELTVAEFATLNGLALDRLVRLLEAAAEADAFERERAAAGGDAGTGQPVPPRGPIGYTGAYRELADSGIESRSVVAVQSAQGPD